jgi:hypothetical protein
LQNKFRNEVVVVRPMYVVLKAHGLVQLHKKFLQRLLALVLF